MRHLELIGATSLPDLRFSLKMLGILISCIQWMKEHEPSIPEERTRRARYRGMLFTSLRLKETSK